MHLIEDNRDKNREDDDEESSGRLPRLPTDPATEEVVFGDSEALKLKGKNPLAEEEGVEEDDNGGD
jgi:hypothetical protein